MTKKKYQEIRFRKMKPETFELIEGMKAQFKVTTHTKVVEKLLEIYPLMKQELSENTQTIIKQGREIDRLRYLLQEGQEIIKLQISSTEGHLKRYKDRLKRYGTK